MLSASDPGTPPLIASPRTIFSLLFLLYMFDYIDRLVIVSLFPFLKQDWGITDTQCGLLVSAVYWSILIFTLPVSVLIDRWSRKKSIGLMALLWSAATLACAFTRSFNQLFAARTAIGLGEAGYAPGGTAMIASMFPKARRARMLGIWNASIPLGSALGIVLGGVIAEHVGWRRGGYPGCGSPGPAGHVAEPVRHRSACSGQRIGPARHRSPFRTIQPGNRHVSPAPVRAAGRWPFPYRFVFSRRGQPTG